MNNSQNPLKAILSFITYKKQKEIKEFFIPEINEISSKSSGMTSSSPQTVEQDKLSANINLQSTSKLVIGKKRQKNRYHKSNPKDKLNTSDNGALPNSVEKDFLSNLEFIKKAFNFPDNKDIVLREISIGKKSRGFIAFIDGMVDRNTINNFILRPLLDKKKYLDLEEVYLHDFIFNGVIEINQVKKIEKFCEAITEILSGNTLVYIEGSDYYISCETKGFDKRAVEKPVIEAVVRGSQEAFNENLRTNVTLIRKIIKNKNLISEYMTLGDRNNNLCAVMYIKDLANPFLVKEVKRRMASIKTDFIQGDGMLEQFIEDSGFSTIPSIISTERPDKTANAIIDGKVAIIPDGTPFALLVPATLTSLIKTQEDTNLRVEYGNFIRLIRLFGIFSATLIPALYIALTSFHREMIPTDLLIAIASARENVPFPTIIEILFMELSFELIREAGIRMPGIVGNTLGIIGALLLGQAAVQANMVSPVMIIIVAFTGIGNFAIPNYSVAFGIRIYRLIFILAGALFGFFGITMALMCASALVINRKSFGVPLFSGVAPLTHESTDSIFRSAIWKEDHRQDSLNPLDTVKQPVISRKWPREDAINPKDINSGKESNNE